MINTKILPNLISGHTRSNEVFFTKNHTVIENVKFLDFCKYDLKWPWMTREPFLFYHIKLHIYSSFHDSSYFESSKTIFCRNLRFDLKWPLLTLWLVTNSFLKRPYSFSQSYLFIRSILLKSRKFLLIISIKSNCIRLRW